MSGVKERGTTKGRTVVLNGRPDTLTSLPGEREFSLTGSRYRGYGEFSLILRNIGLYGTHANRRFAARCNVNDQLETM